MTNRPYPPWSQATWSERTAMAGIWIIGIAIFIGVLIIASMIMEGIAERSVDHDRCLKHATNGYEIERCQR